MLTAKKEAHSATNRYLIPTPQNRVQWSSTIQVLRVSKMQPLIHSSSLKGKLVE